MGQIIKKELVYYMNRNGKFYFRTQNRKEKLIINNDVKSIPAFDSIHYGNKFYMEIETN
jgi:hypothetical protein